jgi:LysM repeat protein
MFLKKIQIRKQSRFRNEKSSSNTVSSEDDYVTYTVQQGDTVFSIVNKFGVTIDELIALNPELSKGLKTGMVLKIKKQDPAYVKKNGDALSVVMMLPLDTAQEKHNIVQWLWISYRCKTCH